MKILHPSTKKSAELKGYQIQISQHAPDGYSGAYSAQVYPPDNAPHLDFDLGCTKDEARENVRRIVKNL